MKLHEIKPLFENDNTNKKDEFWVYKMSAPGVPEVYYGYNRHHQMDKDADEKLIHAVLGAASRLDDEGESRRGTSRMVTLAGGPDNVIIEPLEGYEAETEAFIRRNDERRNDPNSITRASRFPTRVMDMIRANNPNVNWRKPKPEPVLTAKQALASDKFSPQELEVISKEARKAAMRGGISSSPMLTDLHKSKTPVDAFKAKWLANI